MFVQLRTGKSSPLALRLETVSNSLNSFGHKTLTLTQNNWQKPLDDDDDDDDVLNVVVVVVAVYDDNDVVYVVADVDFVKIIMLLYVMMFQMIK